jgi:hypothetical protein
MTDQRSDGGFSVAPEPLGPLQGGRARRRRVTVALVGLAAVAILAIGWLGPRLASRPPVDGFSVATPRLAPTPAAPSAAPYATQLPALTGDAGWFSGQVAVVSNGFRIVDLGTGQTITTIPAVPGEDGIVPTPGGDGWTCVCMGGGSVKDVQLIRFDPLGHESDRRTIGRLGTASGPDRSLAVQTGLDLAADGQTGVLAVAVQGPSDWTYSIASLDLEAGRLGPLVSLGTQRLKDGLSNPAPAESQRVVLGPQVRLSPGGDRALVWATLHVGYTTNGQNGSVGWTVPLDKDGTPLAGKSVPDLGGDSICFVGGFLAPDQFAAGCVRPEWSIDTFATDGVLTRRLEMPDLADFGSDMLFDTANDAIWGWNGTAQHLVRIDAVSGNVIEMTFDPNAETSSEGEHVGGEQPVWSRPDATVPRPGMTWPQMAGSADGTRLYLLGYVTEPAPTGAPQTAGILVVDPRTMALLDRWTADAAYISIDVGLDGSVVMASGLAGEDERGEASPWESSVTFHDARDGRILARYGRLGSEGVAMIIEP